MAGYAPLFDSIATGTLYGRWPDIGVWPLVLALADRYGHLDVTPHYLAGVTGLPVDDVIACMKRFCAPDPYSRTKAENGSRLVLLEEHRDWGWRVVNHTHYREKARKSSFDAARVEDGRNKDRMGTRDDPRRPAISRADPPSESNANINADSDKSKKKTVGGAARPAPTKRCPPEFQVDAAFALGELPDLDVEREAANFKDCEFKTAHSDWEATWRRWIRTCRTRGQYAKKQATVRKWD